MESTTTNNQIKEVRELFNEIINNLSREEINEIRNKIYRKEVVCNYLKEKDHLTDSEENKLKYIGKYIKKLNNDLKKLQKYQDNITYGLDYLFNEEDYYKPTEVKSAFDGNYVLYERRGDKDGKLVLYEYFDGNYVLYERRGDKDGRLALYEYFDNIKPYLKGMIIISLKVNGKYR